MNDSSNPPNTMLHLIKLGGSLLDFPETPVRIQRWLDNNQGTTNLWVTGGGRWADLIRDFDQNHPVTATTTHWAAIAAMTLTASFLSGWFPDWPWLSSIDDFDNYRKSSSSEKNAILSTEPILRQLGCDLPASWDVTSDSIAAWLANRFSIPRLLLFKACDPVSNDPDELARAGQVDRFLPTIDLAAIEFRCVNLNDSRFDSPHCHDGLQ